MQVEKYGILLKYSKRAEIVFFSQLDVMRIFERAMRRAELPIYFTQGYKPHPKMSFKNALKLGVEGEEQVVLYFTKRIAPDDFRRLFTPQLPQGLHVSEIADL